MTKRSNPEALLQIRCANLLRQRLLPPTMWIAGAAGLYLPIGVRMKAKAQGILERGWSDISILAPHGLHAVELKKEDAPKSALSPEQREFRDLCKLAGIPWAEIRTVEAFEMLLEAWSIPLRPDPFAPRV